MSEPHLHTKSAQRLVQDYRNWFEKERWAEDGWDAEGSAANFALDVVAVERDVIDLLAPLAVDTLLSHDDWKSRGWVMREIPNEAEVRAILQEWKARTLLPKDPA